MISLASMRKTKAHTVMIVLMFVASAMLLNLGLLIINFGTYFDKTADELHSSDICYIIPGKLYTTEVDQYLKNNGNITAMEKAEAFMVDSDVKYGSGDRHITFLLSSSDVLRSISQWKAIDGAKPLDDSLTGMSVYLPNEFALNGGYKVNDKLTLRNGNKTAEFTIKGFSEDIFFSQLETGPSSIYMPQAVYDRAFAELSPEDHAVVVFTDLKNVDKSVESGIRDIYHDGILTALDLSAVKTARTKMANMTAAMAVTFAMIIAVVCLIIIWFRISNSVEEDMLKTGSLKAVGYTGRQIISTVITQYTAIAFARSIAGIILSYLFIPIISKVLSVQTGLDWTQGFDGSISGFMLLFILAVIAAVSFLVARRIRKISPITALRGGLTTHSFRRNRMPLDKSKGNLPLRLGIKSNLQNVRQSLMIVIITLAVGFSGTFGMIMFYNTMVDTSTFAEAPGMELSNVSVLFDPAKDNSGVVSAIRNMPHVQKVQYMDTDTVKVDNADTSVTVMQDYGTKKTITVYEGRYPRHRNETVLAAVSQG